MVDCFHCGTKNEQGANFCIQCGAPLTTAAPSQGGAAPPEVAAPQQSAPPKKKRTGLIIGLIAGGVALIGVLAAAYFLFFSGPGIKGLWVCEDRGWALRIENGVLTEYSPAGTGETSYTYKRGQGTAVLSGGEVSFSVKDGEMALAEKETGDQYLFTRQDDADVEDVIAAGLRGLWSNEELGNVVELGGKDSFRLHSVSSESEGAYSFDLKTGRGTITLDGKEYRFTAGWDVLSVEEMGDFNRADNGLDVAAFVHRHALGRLLATWCDTSGKNGSITFEEDGSLRLEVYGLSLKGTYTYDIATGEGVIDLDDADENVDFTLLDGTLTVQDETPLTYTQEYVEQPGAEDYYTAIAGVWESDQFALVLREDGTMLFYVAGISLPSNYAFNPMGNTGTILPGDPNGDSLDFIVMPSRGLLMLNGSFYEKQGVEEPDDVLGLWFCENGTSGTKIGRAHV